MTVRKAGSQGARFTPICCRKRQYLCGSNSFFRASSEQFEQAERLEQSGQFRAIHGEVTLPIPLPSIAFLNGNKQKDCHLR